MSSTSTYSEETSHISYLLPSANEYKIEKHAATVTQPGVGQDVPLLDETSVTLGQLRRSEVPQPYEYKASANLKQESSATLRTTASAMSGHHETAQETPVNLDHLRLQESAGVKQLATSISQPSVTIDSPILDESAINLDQHQRSEKPQTIQYKPPANIQSSAGSILTTTSALGAEEPAQETPVNITQLRQPAAKDLPSYDTAKQQASSVIQPSTTTDLPVFDESAVNLAQIHRSDVPHTVQYKSSVDIQPSSGSLLTSRSALSGEEPAQESSMTYGQLKQQQPQASKQQATSIFEPSVATDTPILDETAVHLDLVHRPDAPQFVQYKPPTDIQPSAGSILTTASALSREEPAQETSVNINQLRQPTAKDLLSTDTTKQQILSVTQPSTTTDLPVLDETAVHLDQIHRPEAPQPVQYKAPADIQPSTGSILTTVSALTGEQSAEESSLTLNQVRQQQPQALKQRATSISQPAPAFATPILDETAVYFDQIQRPETPQTIQYKAPANIQPSTGTILTTTSALGGEEPAQETPVNITQLRQPTAKDLPSTDTAKQQASSVTQPSATTDSAVLDDTAVHLGQIHRPEAPQPVQYKASTDIQPATGSILTTASALSGEQSAEESSIAINQLRKQQPQALKQRATSISQPAPAFGIPILEETAVYLDQIQRPETPQTIQYKAPADIQPSTGTILTTTSALGGEEPAQETPVNITQLRQPTAKDLPSLDTAKQQASSVTQLSTTTDFPALDETAVNLDQIQRSETPQTIQYKAPTDIQPSAGSLLTTASALSGEEPAQESSVYVSQLRQPTAKDLPSPDTAKQQASSVTQLSATTDLPILDETAVHLDQIHRPDVSQTVQYKAPSDIQPSAGSLLTNTSALSVEEPAQESSVYVAQLRQPTAKDLPGPDTAKQQASPVTQLSATTDLPVLDEIAVHLDQIHRPDVPETVQYKAPGDIQPSTGSLLTTATALSGEEPAQESSVYVAQLRQPTAKDLPSTNTAKQQASPVTQLSATAAEPVLDETAINLDQIQRSETPQAVQYKAPGGIEPSAGSLFTTATALSGEEPAQKSSVYVAQLRQPTATDLRSTDTAKQQASPVTQLSATAAEPVLDETAVNLDQIQRSEAPQAVQYKAPGGIKPSAGSLLTTATALSGEEPAQESSVYVAQLRQPTATDLPSTDTAKQQPSSVIQPSATTDLPVLDETAVHLDQIHRPDVPQTVQYKAPSGIQPSAGSLFTNTSALSVEEPAQESSVYVAQLRQPTAKDLPGPDTAKQQASSVIHLSATTDLPVFDESAVHLDQIQRSEAPQTIQYKAPTDIQPSAGSLLTTASALSGEEAAQESSIYVGQFRQPTAKDLPSADTAEQQALSVTQPSATTDLPVFDESAVHLDQIQRSKASQAVQYKAPGDIQPSAGSLLTTASALSGEEPAQESSVYVAQLRQPTATYLPSTDTAKQQASPVIQPSATTDLPVLDETAVHLDQIHRPDVPQTVQYKAPTDIQPSAGSLLTTASALSGEEAAQESSIYVGQFRQPTAKDLPSADTAEQQAFSVTQPSATTDLPVFDESAVHLDQIQRSEAPQAVQYKAPGDIQPSAGSLLTRASALSGEEPAQESSVYVAQLRQPTATNLPSTDTAKQQASPVIQPSATAEVPVLDETCCLS